MNREEAEFNIVEEEGTEEFEAVSDFLENSGLHITFPHMGSREDGGEIPDRNRLKAEAEKLVHSSELDYELRITPKVDGFEYNIPDGAYDVNIANPNTSFSQDLEDNTYSVVLDHTTY